MMIFKINSLKETFCYLPIPFQPFNFCLFLGCLHRNYFLKEHISDSCDKVKCYSHMFLSHNLLICYCRYHSYFYLNKHEYLINTHLHEYLINTHFLDKTMSSIRAQIPFFWSQVPVTVPETEQTFKY